MYGSTNQTSKRTGAPVTASDAIVQRHASARRVRAMRAAIHVTEAGTPTPTMTCPAPGPLPGGFGIDPALITPATGATATQTKPSSTRFPTVCVFVPIPAIHRQLHA